MAALNGVQHGELQRVTGELVQQCIAGHQLNDVMCGVEDMECRPRTKNTTGSRCADFRPAGSTGKFT